MNNIIRLKGKFNEKKNLSSPGIAKFGKNKYAEFDKIQKLNDKLKKLSIEWENNIYIDGALISVEYNRIVPKSQRVKSIFSYKSMSPNKFIRGARFNADNTKHIIAYHISLDNLAKTIDCLNKTALIVKNVFDNLVDNNKIININDYAKKIESYDLSKSLFASLVVDISNIDDFYIADNSDEINIDSVLNLYDIGVEIDEIMTKLSLAQDDYKIIDKTMMKIDNIEALNIVKEKIPYLISMSVTDISTLSFKQKLNKLVDKKLYEIPLPLNEPTIGVIDTLFNESVYFSEWVKYKDMVDENIPKTIESYDHGTEVTSIIVDGGNLNPEFDDGCGRFKVKHFGVAVSGKNSSLGIVKNIKRIVKENPEIHVWNLSLGSVSEINNNSISIEADALDDIQWNSDAIFVIAGTNDNNDTLGKKIGAPADSINSIVVNAVNFSKEIPSYARSGNVLSFFNKPDISYYGGDNNDRFVACCSSGAIGVYGTSFAAPWISRKLSYLIDVLGFSKEIAKALIIDSAADWNKIDDTESKFLGFGVVPIKIEDIIKSRTDEIKFFIQGSSNLYDTYTHNIPVPLQNEKYPFVAKATLVYFPKCSRNQGVDYTNTELDIYFGRIDNKGVIKSINENMQSEGLGLAVKEDVARQFYRKWDNVKHIKQTLKKNSRAKISYDNVLWGLSIKSKERLEKKDEKGLKFGVVITLKEINGVNRFSEFINQCSLRGWLVEQVDVNNKINIYNVSHEEIEFE